ncbi:potassium channel family protein [Phytoactinopolyspora mesophila]|uniref:Two pore domain potassium channel family protein n=1 Tax=Phytoactinopolyspora mesophila TaxID=2650750 RepID=A0A7K3M467_9ACTN|nr:potassium channel family protein [Phytoactinopolyspora mesophila]NDL58036.1 two pore domain potassium channel family protein [Phytoactinopolyspora mesophila]
MTAATGRWLPYLAGMLGLLLMIRRFIAAVRISWRDRAFRGVTVTLVTLLVSATIFYTLVEGWSVLDSAYFSVVTGLTIGYGDLTPEQPIAKVFTMLYALLAVGLFVALATSLANSLMGRRAHKKRSTSRHKRGSHADEQDVTQRPAE